MSKGQVLSFFHEANARGMACILKEGKNWRVVYINLGHKSIKNFVAFSKQFLGATRRVDLFFFSPVSTAGQALACISPHGDFELTIGFSASAETEGALAAPSFSAAESKGAEDAQIRAALANSHWAQPAQDNGAPGKPRGNEAQENQAQNLEAPERREDAEKGATQSREDAEERTQESPRGDLITTPTSPRLDRAQACAKPVACFSSAEAGKALAATPGSPRQNQAATPGSPRGDLIPTPNSPRGDLPQGPRSPQAPLAGRAQGGARAVITRMAPIRPGQEPDGQGGKGTGGEARADAERQRMPLPLPRKGLAKAPKYFFRAKYQASSVGAARGHLCATGEASPAKQQTTPQSASEPRQALADAKTRRPATDYDLMLWDYVNSSYDPEYADIEYINNINNINNKESINIKDLKAIRNTGTNSGLKNHVSYAGDSGYTPGGQALRRFWFERFFTAFGCYQGKADAWAVWQTLKPSGMTHGFARLLCEAARAEARRREQLPAGQFYKQAKGWLQSRGWEDYLFALEQERREARARAGIATQKDAIAKELDDEEYRKACRARKELEKRRQELAAGACSGRGQGGADTGKNRAQQEAARDNQEHCKLLAGAASCAGTDGADLGRSLARDVLDKLAAARCPASGSSRRENPKGDKRHAAA